MPCSYFYIHVRVCDTVWDGWERTRVYIPLCMRVHGKCLVSWQMDRCGAHISIYMSEYVTQFGMDGKGLGYIYLCV